MKFFASREEKGTRTPERIPRHSSGWGQLLKELREQQELRVLDFGLTSPTNINFLTGLGHGIYMADLIQPSREPSWKQRSEHSDEIVFNVEQFLSEHMDFGERRFDVVLLWDTLDYLETPLAEAVVAKLHQVTTEGAKLLSFFHVKPESECYRYHLRDDQNVDMQMVETAEIQRLLTTRQIESLFADYAGYKFFLAKDNLREVLVTR